MSLPVRQRRVLGRIDRTLKVSDPRLVALFAIFTRLAQGEDMPRFEQLRHGIAARLHKLGAAFRSVGARRRAIRRARRGPKAAEQSATTLTATRPRRRPRAVILYPVAIALAIGAIVLAAQAGGGSSRGCVPAHTVAAQNVATRTIPAKPGEFAAPASCRPGGVTPLMTGR